MEEGNDVRGGKGGGDVQRCGGKGRRDVDQEIDELEARLADAKRRKLAENLLAQKVFVRAVVECKKSAVAPKAQLDCEASLLLADFEQTFKVMRDVLGRFPASSKAVRVGAKPREEEEDSLRRVAQAYIASMKGFVQQQTELALTSLTSNTVKGDKFHAQKVREQYSQAHTYLLSEERRQLGLEELLAAHQIMMQGLCATPGRFRGCPARCGNRYFALPGEISKLMTEFFSAFQTVLSRQDLTMCGKAAWACAHLLAIHPFHDGNGRLARLLANWVLLSSGLPFSVVLCASDAQRAEYIEVPPVPFVIEKENGIEFVQVCVFGATTGSRLMGSPLLQACKSFHSDGMTSKLACVVSCAVARGWKEFDRYRERAMRTGLQDAAERASIDYIRKTKSLGSCIVCQELHPDIMTTCCAAAYHLECLTKWLVSGHNASCCKCRTDISYVPPRLPSHADGNGPVRSGRAAVGGSSRNEDRGQPGSSGEAGGLHASGGAGDAALPRRSRLHVETRGPVAVPESVTASRDDGVMLDAGPRAVIRQFDLGGMHPAPFTRLGAARHGEDEEDTTSTACDLLGYSSSDDDTYSFLEDDGQRRGAMYEAEAAAVGSDSSSTRGVGASSCPPLSSYTSAGSSRRQPKCPKCRENQQASDCDFGVCGQCCRTLRREQGGHTLHSACRRHPA